MDIPSFSAASHIGFDLAHRFFDVTMTGNTRGSIVCRS